MSIEDNIEAIVKRVTEDQESQDGVTFLEANQAAMVVCGSLNIREAIEKLMADKRVQPSEATTLVDGFEFDPDGNPTRWIGYPWNDQEYYPMSDTEKAEEKVKAPKKSKAASLEGLSPDDFFNLRDNGKDTFKPGYDAKYGALCKRIIAGKADKIDLKLFKSAKLSEHTKVESSDHLRPLRDEARMAMAG